jgi:SET domain-containing protein
MKKFKVTSSAIHGKGVIATKLIKKGEFIAYVRGPVKYFNSDSKEKALSHPNWIGFKKNHWIDPETPFCYINHSCTASAGIRGTKSVHAIRDIHEGEELTLDYSTTEIDMEWSLDPKGCQCGSKQCRKKVCSIQTLNRETFQRYLPYIPTAFIQVYTKKHARS